MKILRYLALVFALTRTVLPLIAQTTNEPPSVLAPGAKLEKLADEFQFAEGATCDAAGNVFFTDQPNDRIMKWSVDGKLSTYKKPAGRANGMCFDAKGNLLPSPNLYKFDADGVRALYTAFAEDFLLA